MSLSGRELLMGGFLALAAPPSPEDGPDFARARAQVAALLCFLMAQEIEKAAAIRVQENRAIRDLFIEAADGGWAPTLSPRLRELARGDDQDLNLSALDAANAELRRALILVHAAVEDSGSAAARARERRILRLYRDTAAAFRLDYPHTPGA